MCHVQKFCDDCHGLEMPHPSGWAEGEDGHSVYAEQDRTVCEQCHTERPDLCGMCHHEAYEPEQGSWVQQHFIEVETQGSDYCFECHLPAYCVRCHVVWSSDGELPAE